MTAEDFDVTLFRGIPTSVESISTTDPFGPAEASLKFGKVTLFDRRGQGDLWWCVPEANVDIAWVVEKATSSTWRRSSAERGPARRSTGAATSAGTSKR